MASPKKSIAIVGAGPAGLVTARTLLRSGKFDVTVFEKGSDIGGLWSPGGYIDPTMTTNLNQFTVSFSGLSWDEVNLGREGFPPMFPKAWMVRRYLYEYQRRYVPTGLVRLETLVTDATLAAHEEAGNIGQKWKLTVKSISRSHPELKEHFFDYLVVTTGPFSRPKGLKTPRSANALQASRVPILHSTKYRTPEDVLQNDTEAKGGKVLVVGGSHSGSEIATKMALGLSSATGPNRVPPLEIIHLTSRRLFALSPLLPTGDGSFEPADFKLYNRSDNPDPSPTFSYGLLDNAKHRAIVDMIQHLIGEPHSTSENHAGEKLQLSAVISETYSQMTRAGLIKTVQGALVEFEIPTDDDSYRLTAIIESSPGKHSTIQDIVGVVHATGFDTAGSLDFLSEDVKTLLDYDADCHQYPVILDTSYISQNMKVPSLAIIGFAAQYWGVMEMQARAVTSAWSTGDIYPAIDERERISTFYSHLRDEIRAGNHVTLPPYPFGDYVGLMEQGARELGLKKLNEKWSDSEGPICAARYLDPTAGDEEAHQALEIMTRLQDIYRKPTIAASHTARATFYALLGKWTTQGNHATEIGATQQKELIFHPKLSRSADIDFEYTASEHAPTSKTHTIYRYKADSNEIWILPTDHALNKKAQEPTAKLVFNEPADPVSARRIEMHPTLEGNTFVGTEYTFHFDGTRLKRFDVISGKDSETWFPVSID